MRCMAKGISTYFHYIHYPGGTYFQNSTYILGMSTISDGKKKIVDSPPEETAGRRLPTN